MDRGATTSCVGCKFLVSLHVHSVCSATDPTGDRTRVNQLSGRREVIVYWRPTIEEQRATTGACKPERLLYRPSLWTRIKERWN